MRVDGGYVFAWYDIETTRIMPQDNSKLIPEDDLVFVEPTLTLEQTFSGAPERGADAQDIEAHEKNKKATLEWLMSNAQQQSQPWPYFSVDFRVERVNPEGQHKIVCVVQQYTGNAFKAIVDDLNAGRNPHRGPFSDS